MSSHGGHGSSTDSGSSSTTTTSSSSSTHGGKTGSTGLTNDEKADNYINTIMALIPCGIVLVLMIRRIILVAERKIHQRLAARRRAAGEAVAGAAATMPFFAKWFAVMERPFMRPVGVWWFKDWTWLQFILLNFILWSAFALNTVVALTPGASGPNVIKHLAVRTGRTATVRLPMIYALAGRQNLVTLLTGVDYHTLRTYHKLIGLLSFTEAFVHTVLYVEYFPAAGQAARLLNEWNSTKKPGYLQWGSAAMVGGLFCCLFGWHLIRKRTYEVFLALHVAGAIVYLAGCYYHQQAVMYSWVWAGVAVWALERAWRWTRLVVNRFGFHKPVIMAEAQVSNGAVLLRVPFPEGGWRAGQHFYLYFWGTGFLLKPWLYGQAHPFTVANSPGSGETHLEFVIKVYDGTTAALARTIERQNQPSVRVPISVEGPYSHRPQCEEFDRVLLFAGGSGITYASSALGDIVRRGREGSAIKEVKFVWVVQRLDQVQWIRSLLPEARAFADKTGLDLSIDLYATQQDTYIPNALASDSGASTPSSLDDDKKADLSPSASTGSDSFGRATLHYARPDASFVVSDFLIAGKGRRNMVLACGPVGLGDQIRVAGGKNASALDEVHVASFDC